MIDSALCLDFGDIYLRGDSNFRGAAAGFFIYPRCNELSADKRDECLQDISERMASKAIFILKHEKYFKKDDFDQPLQS
jgi:hypothetical protein